MHMREAHAGDDVAIATLVADLKHPLTRDDVRARLPMLAAAGLPVLVADDGGVIGCATWSVMPVLHRPGPVGRISLLVVAAGWRGRGVGRRLVEAVEARCRDRGCVLVEVTSHERLAEAHGFYEAIGYRRTSVRFGKPLDA